jgi:hypothetical protein
VTVEMWFLVAALLVNGLLVGASMDQTVKQLPARHRIGVVAYSNYSKAADLHNGVIFYGVLGVGGALIAIMAAVVGLLHQPGGQITAVLWTIIALSLAHSAATSWAAPTNFRQRNAAGDIEQLTAILNRFTTLQAIRASLQVLTLLALAWGLVAYISVR